MADENTITQPAAEGVPAAEHTRTGHHYRPNVDILERPDELVLLADVPGTTGDQIDVGFEDGNLTIHARVKPRQHKDIEYLLREYGVGDYYRTFRISEAIDASKISAEYAEGVLALHLPKAEETRPRKIAVKSQ